MEQVDYSEPKEVDTKATMSNEYNEFREEFDVIHYIIGMAIFFFMMWLSGNCNWGSKKKEAVDENDRETPFTLEDLAKFDGI